MRLADAETGRSERSPVCAVPPVGACGSAVRSGGVGELLATQDSGVARWRERNMCAHPVPCVGQK